MTMNESLPLAVLMSYFVGVVSFTDTCFQIGF
ncbi:MAG: hypothetical protein J07HQW2_00153 [Haloquadratum walsbyi J07HQW2]|uniref:Uncharacterized protein n=1 Tax=Haloquadratum walsbyi J07HQW2 TaxID=1238425 RepID=U1NA67_9EURY|nr:MAG: hypothetical protein J07HQW2_00153 [Haloquadratum walsbyi J07HQW2]